MAMILQLRGTREAPKAVRSRMETIIFSVKEAENWHRPPFQRPIRINDRVRDSAEQLKGNGGIITGVLTLGKFDGKTWIVDGQHRIEAFKLSGIQETIADVRICDFDTLAEMADEFVRLNTALVKMRPDDVLRGMESANPVLQKIRKHCAYVGYDNIRRNEYAPILSMSQVLRCWWASGAETPTLLAVTAATISESLDAQGVEQLTQFLNIAHGAWGRESTYARLWASLNMTMCMWLWRRLVLERTRPATKRFVILNAALFSKCMMSLSADSHYIDWLAARKLSDRDRGACYNRIKSLWVKRLIAEGVNNPKFPSVEWAAG
jgi:hypothetical protein